LGDINKYNIINIEVSPTAYTINYKVAYINQSANSKFCSLINCK